MQAMEMKATAMPFPVMKATAMKTFLITSFFISLLTITAVAQALEISLGGSFKGGVILSIDGKQRVLRVGESSPEGVKLVAAEDDSAIIELGGERVTVGPNRSISTSFTEAEKAQVRIPSSRGGHYIAQGRINGQAVEFMVDTGATTIAINLPTAQRLGINYRAGEAINVSTANGVTTAYLVNLDTVSVGTVTLNNVQAAVSMGNFPNEILLGNSFLRRVTLRQEEGLLILESRF